MAKKNCVIYETLNDVKTMQAHKTGDGFMHLSGVFGVCGVRNNNQRVYETKNYGAMVTEMQKRIKEEGGIPGELEHPSTMNITLENISHKIDSINIDENGVVTGEITLLNTPKGQIAQAIVESGLPLYISSRAQGSVDKNGNVKLESLKTYDLVGSPGFSQAKLKLNEGQIAESICDSVYYITDKSDKTNNPVNENNKNNNNMDNETLKRIQESMAEMQSKIDYLEAQNNMLSEQLEAKSTVDDESLSRLCEGIQHWAETEFAPEIQNWVVENYSKHVQDWIVDEFAPEVQKWVVEEYSQEVENWTINEFAHELQNWIVEQYSPEIENWIVEQYSPEVENWITKEYGAALEKDIKESVMSNVENKLNESLTNNRENKLAAIDNVLTLLESHKTEKPVYGRRAILESHENEPMFIAQMPTAARVKWEMLSENAKEGIQRKAKLWNFNQPGAIERFWESVNFEAAPEIKRINEGLEDVQDEWEKRIRMQFRRRHN